MYYWVKVATQKNYTTNTIEYMSHTQLCIGKVDCSLLFEVNVVLKISNFRPFEFYLQNSHFNTCTTQDNIKCFFCSLMFTSTISLMDMFHNKRLLFQLSKHLDKTFKDVIVLNFSIFNNWVCFSQKIKAFIVIYTFPFLPLD